MMTFVDGVASVEQQHSTDVNPYRAHFGTLSAEGRSFAQMFEVRHSLGMRCNERSDGATVNRSIAVPTNVLINGTDIQTSSAPNTIQAFPLFGACQQIGTPVVQEDHVHPFRSVRLARSPRPADDTVICRQLLSGAMGRKEWPEKI